MRRRLPPLNALLAFDAAARHNSFTRAAQELCVAQPSVTRHIANLESWMGVPLFHRHGNALSLTEEGDVMATIATAAFDRMELALREVKRLKKHDLVVGASFGVAHLWVMPRISAMRRASGMNINLVTADDYSTFDERSIDFSIRFGHGKFGEQRADLLFEEHCHIIATPAFLDAHPQFDPRNVLDNFDPKLLLDHGDPHRVGWMDWHTWQTLSGAKCPDISAMQKVESYPTMLDMVCAGEGISIGTLGIEDDLVASGKLLRLGAPVSRPGYGYYLVYHAEQLANPAFARLRASLLAKTDNPHTA